MPGIKSLLKGWHEGSGKDKLSDFVEEYWHYDNISNKNEKQFVNSYLKWAEKNGYHQSETYAMSKKGIPTLSRGSNRKRNLHQKLL